MIAIQEVAVYAERIHGISSSLEVAVTSQTKGWEVNIPIGKRNANVRHSIPVSFSKAILTNCHELATYLSS